VLQAAGVSEIIEYRPSPCGRVVQTYENVSSVQDDQFPVCKHGGWFECGLQAQQLCALNLTGSVDSTLKLIDCHFDSGSATQNPNFNLSHACAESSGVLDTVNGGVSTASLEKCMFHQQYPANVRSPHPRSRPLSCDTLHVCQCLCFAL